MLLTTEPEIYSHTVAAALAKTRRVLKAGGYELGKVTGRYSDYGSTQRIVPGWNVHRIGVSKTVALVCRGWTRSIGSAADFPSVLSLLRSKNLPFDDRGWLECKHY